MNIVLIITIVTLYAIVIASTYYSLNEFETSFRFKYIIGGVTITTIITLIIIAINKIGNSQFNKINIMIFSPINALLIMPSIAKKINRYKGNLIEYSKAKQKIIINLIIFIILLIIEFNYIKELQNIIK